MKDSEAILWLVAIGGGIYVLNKTGLLDGIGSVFSPKPWSKETAVTALTSAGVQVKTMPSGVYIPVKGGTVRVQEGWNPNYTQRALIGLDRIIPGDWLTRAVLGI